MSDPEFVRVGQIVGAFGLKGYVKVDPHTDFMDRFAPGTRLRLDGEWVEVQDSKWHKGRPLLKLSGVRDKTAAEALQWKYLEGMAQERPPLDEDEFYTEDLIGMEVLTEAGESLGPVAQVHPYPAHDTLEVAGILIPAVKEFVLDVDVDARKITVRLIPGMRPDEG